MNPSQEIDNLVATHDDWRGATLEKYRRVILGVDTGIVEEWKWMGAPVWELDGILVVGNIFKTKVKLGFMYGALIDDPDSLFNGELGGNQRRSVELAQGDEVDEHQFAALVQRAIDYNHAKRQAKPVASRARSPKKPAPDAAPAS